MAVLLDPIERRLAPWPLAGDDDGRSSEHTIARTTALPLFRIDHSKLKSPAPSEWNSIEGIRKRLVFWRCALLPGANSPT